MAPDIERIIALKPEAILLSPFENSGGYGKLDKLHVPIIEAADYMESSPLGRAEWMKFYGMLFGNEEGMKREKVTEYRVLANQRQIRSLRR
jgi:iron complex transport system substrate-binding protein